MCNLAAFITADWHAVRWLIAEQSNLRGMGSDSCQLTVWKKVGHELYNEVNGLQYRDFGVSVSKAQTVKRPSVSSSSSSSGGGGGGGGGGASCGGGSGGGGGRGGVAAAFKLDGSGCKPQGAPPVNGRRLVFFRVTGVSSSSNRRAENRKVKRATS